MGKARSSEAFERYAKATDAPLLVLAAAMIPLLVIPLFNRLSPEWENAFLAADYFIWAVFALDYVTRLYLSPQRMKYVRTHIPDLVIVAVPFLRPLRILRSVRVLRALRLVRIAAVLGKGFSEMKAILRSRGLNYVLLIVVALIFVCALVVVEIEKGQPNSNLQSFPGGLWWAATTVTTVGYGDRFPVTAAGRGVAVLLMIAGIALFGVLTASIATYFVESDKKDEPEEVTLQSLADRLDSIEKRLSEKSSKN